MIKYLLLALVAVSICYAIPASNTNLNTSVFKAMFLNLVKDKCFKNGTNPGFERFINLTENSTNCLKMKAELSQVFVTPVKDIKNDIKHCTKELLLQLKNCFPEESKDWPQANLDITFSIMDFFYENKDQLLSPNVRKFVELCTENLFNTETQTEFVMCLENNDKLFSVINVYSLCQGINVLQNCSLQQLEKRCKNDVDVESLKMKFFAAMKQPCLEYETMESSTDNPLTLYPRVTPSNMNPELM